MSVVVPILFTAVLLGLYAPRNSKAVWWVLLGVIALVLVKVYVKGM